MTVYRLYIPPRSHLPHAAGVLSALLCCNTIYTLISMPHYTQYWDYWATLAASLLLSLACFFVIRRRPELVLIPAVMVLLDRTKLVRFYQPEPVAEQAV